MPKKPRKNAKGKPAAVDPGTKARRVARKVVGQVPASRVIVPKSERPPKHKKPIGAGDEE